MEKTIEAPAEQVWETISRPGHLEQCHPFCKDNPVEIWPGAESRDEVHYLSGWKYQRQFRNWIEGTGYDLDIGRRGGGMSSVSWRITPITENSCKLSITVYPHVMMDTPVALRWIAYRVRMRPMLQKYLDSVVRGVEWFVTRREPVPKNAFGKHPWFSES